MKTTHALELKYTDGRMMRELQHGSVVCRVAVRVGYCIPRISLSEFEDQIADCGRLDC